MDKEKQQDRAKYRIRFRKAGNLRLVSHHDLMHVFERMLRRAELPLCTTQGFHPQPRMIFAQSLALGIAGSNEVVELELKQTIAPEEVHARLVRQVPPGMEILSTRAIDFKAAAQVRRAFYRLDIPDSFEHSGTGFLARPDGLGSPSHDLAERCAALLATHEVWVERTRPRPRRFNLRPYLSKLTLARRASEESVVLNSNSSFLVPHSSFSSTLEANEELGMRNEELGSNLPGSILEIVVWVTPNGTIRPEEVARLLGLEPLLEHTFFERTFLELHDEVAKDDPEVIPACLLEIPPGSRAPATANTRTSEVLETAAVLVAQTLSAQDESFNA